MLKFGLPLAVEVTDIQEGEWIIQSRNGNKAAYGELVCLYHSRVINVIYRMCGDAALAEDAAQIAFINAWQRLSQFKPAEEGRMQISFRNWLYRIGINAALDILRRHKPQVDLDHIQLVDPGDGIEEDLLKQEQTRQVRQAVLSLPEASRSVLILREYENLSYREIAETLEIPVGTVMSRLNYARTLLTQQLRKFLEDE